MSLVSGVDEVDLPSLSQTLILPLCQEEDEKLPVLSLKYKGIQNKHKVLKRIRK